MAYTPITEWKGDLFHRQLERALQELDTGVSIRQALSVISSTYGDTASVSAKGKNLNKFGKALSVGTTYATVGELQGSQENELFVSTNIIDSIASSSAADTQSVQIEGHTIDGPGNLTFIVQSATLNGQSEVTLSTPLARASRLFVKPSGVFNAPQAVPAGVISVYDNTAGISGGVPNADSATKLLISAGETQSKKCQTSTSSTDYWLVSSVDVGVGNAGGPADRVTFKIETRDIKNGGVFRNIGREGTVTLGENGVRILFDPVLIVPPNHDVRVLAATNSSTAEVFAEISGVLALVV